MEIIVWSGSSTFVAGKTARGIYDNDPQFAVDADKVAKFCAFQLGYPIMDVELQDIHFYNAFEQATLEYSREVNNFKIRDNYINFENSPIPNDTSFDINNVKITPSLGNIIRLSKTYGSEAGSGGNVTYYKGHIDVVAGQQQYDLKAWAVASGSLSPDDSIEIKRVFYQRSPAVTRFLDPTLAGGLATSNFLDGFGYGDSYVGVNYLLMPINYDAMRIQAIEFNDEIRRSQYTFELRNNVLTIQPIPTTSGKYWFEYIKVSERDANYDYRYNQIGSNIPSQSNPFVSNISNVPIGNISYSSINSTGKDWIFNMTLAYAMKMLAMIRGKFTNGIPYVRDGQSLQLNTQDLISEANKKRDDLIQQLREMLDATSRKNQLERQQAEANSVSQTLANIPLPFYIR